MPSWDLPERGVVFWPVGNGDAVTIIVDDDTVVQIDINHYDTADDDDDERVPVVDRLTEVLPQPIGADKPILSVLAISHHDRDHCSGAERLLEAVSVCELWITLRSFVEEKDEPGGLTHEGQVIYDEACRRRQAEVDAAGRGARADPGNRLRVIGNADVLEGADWNEFPKSLLTSAGQFIPTINGEDKSDVIELFVHTPFHEHTEDGDRNESSLGLQVTLKSGTCEKRFLLLGDLTYEVVEAFFDKSQQRGNADRLRWDVLLAPHHCSRNAVRRSEGGKWVDADAAQDFSDHAGEGAVVISSSRPFGEATATDTDPPHDDARTVYENIVGADGFCCTADYADGSDSDPLTIVVTEAECGHVREPRSEAIKGLKTASAVTGPKVRPGDPGTGKRDREFATK